MKEVLTADEYGRVDRAFRGDLGEAMDRAGHAVALACAGRGVGYGSRVTVLAGPGNNGGDGYVAARYLAERGADVVVESLGPPRSSLASSAAEQARRAGVEIRPMGPPRDCDLIVDAVFGGGMRGGLPAEVVGWAGAVTPVVAVDIPTGVDPNSGSAPGPGFSALETVTFGYLKTGHVLGDGPDRCGDVTVADIGIHGGRPSLLVAEEEDAPLPQRRRRSHKWSAGSVLVVGGSPGMIGASVFAGRAALSFGAGSVYLAADDSNRLQAIAPDVPVMTLDDARDDIRRFDVVLAGPGLAPADISVTLPLLQAAENLVLDAGALRPDVLEAVVDSDVQIVVTPHDAEFTRLSGTKPGTFSVRSFARANGITVVRKGSPTMVTDGSAPVLIRTGGPELASIGTGDVLAGMIAALWSRGLDGFRAAISGSFWHGRAGRSLSRRRTVTARGLVAEIGRFAW